MSNTPPPAAAACHLPFFFPTLLRKCTIRIDIALVRAWAWWCGWRRGRRGRRDWRRRRFGRDVEDVSQLLSKLCYDGSVGRLPQCSTTLLFCLPISLHASPPHRAIGRGDGRRWPLEKAMFVRGGCTRYRMRCPLDEQGDVRSRADLTSSAPLLK